MKASKRNLVKTGIAITAFAVMGVLSPAFAGAPVSVHSEKIQNANSTIAQDQEALANQQQKVNALAERYKNEKKAGNEEAAMVTRNELCKARADLDRQEEYLAADKILLTRYHKLALAARREEIKKDKSNLEAYKDKLANDVDNGNETAIVNDANKIAYYQSELKGDRARLDREKEIMNKDLYAVNKKDKQQKNSNIAAGTHNTETAYYVNSSNRVVK